MDKFCGKCKHWDDSWVRNHGSYVYGYCNMTLSNVLYEHDDGCNCPHFKEKNTQMEKQAVVKEDEKVTSIVKEGMEKLIEEEKKP
jgi:hypothetical protein